MTQCKVDGEFYSAALDTASTINAVKEEAASKMGYVRAKAPTPVSVIGVNFDLEEAIEFEIEIGEVCTKIYAHIIPDAPADILLGQEFLKRFSKGYSIMLEEFVKMDQTGNGQKEAICAMEISEDTKQKLE